MNFFFIRRFCSALLLGTLLTSASFAVTSTQAKKKIHRAPPQKLAAGRSHRHRPAAGGKSRYARVHYSSLRVDPKQKAELTGEIAARLKEEPEQPIAYSSALDGFYAQLDARARSMREPGPQAGTVRVLQFGDSHTAADMFTGEARRVFQQQFGDGGIGYSYAGHPFAGYRILGSERSQSAGWKTAGNKFLQLGDGQLGMGGIRISTNRAGEWVTLEAPCTSLELQYLEQPGGGSFTFTDNGGDPVEIQTDAAATGPGTFTYNCPEGEHRFEILTEENAPVTLFGMVALQPGVTWESIGINGAEAPLMLKWDQSIFSQYLKDNSPALIVLAYGTNEAASPNWDEASYRAAFASLIDALHQYVPESSILVVGPADRSTARRRVWHPFAGTDRIVQAQSEVCRTHGCAYWDQRERMGGFGSMQDWVSIGWAQPDHTHFTGEGYRALADALMADLMTGYNAYQEHKTTINQSSGQRNDQGVSHDSPRVSSAELNQTGQDR